MWCLRRNSHVFIAVCSRFNHIGLPKRAICCCQTVYAKETAENTHHKRNLKKFDVKEKEVNDPPLVIQMLSKHMNISANNITPDKLETISQDELRECLDDITWDTNVSVKRKITQLMSEENNDNKIIEDEVANMEDFDEEISLDDEETLRSKDNRIKDKGQTISGFPDPSVPKSKIPCTGCGAELHCQDPIIPGYMPSNKFKSLKRMELRQSHCQRCHLMLNHNICLNVKVDSNEYPQIISKIRNTKGLVIVIVDVTDMRNSIFPNLLKYIGKNRPLYIVGNKVDLIPKDEKMFLQRIKDSLLEECELAGLNENGKNIKHLCIVSAKTGYGVEELVTKLMTHWQLQGEVFLVGCTNVGKSSLFNALLQSDYCKSNVRDIIKRATVSVWPGTTLNLLKFPIVRPEGWRLFMRRSRLDQLRAKKNQEKKQKKKSKEVQEESGQIVTLQGYIGQTDFRGPKEKEAEEKAQYDGQELVSFSLTRKGDLSEMSGRQHIASSTPDMSTLDALNPSRWTFDTPGATNDEQIINMLTPEELQLVLPKTVCVPRVFVVNPSQSMLVSGLGRIDYSQKMEISPLDESSISFNTSGLLASTPKKKLLCDGCGKSFKSKYGLSMHVKSIHNNEWRFKCQICEKGFQQLWGFQGHINKHHNLRPEVCSNCGASYSSKKDLGRHVRNGCPKLKFETCPHCSETFSKSYMKEHIKMHKDVLYRCKTCNKSYKWRSSLRWHREHAHTE